MLATVTDKGQVTVPKEIRDQLGILPGCKLDFEVLPEGELRVRVLSRGAKNLFGMLRRSQEEGLSVEQMDEGISAAVMERVERARK